MTNELNRRLQADWTSMEKFNQFFGLMGHQYRPSEIELTDVKELFPDTTVNMLKDCFEALQLYDLAEIMEKVRPRSLRPALSSEQIEKLRRVDDRPTKYHSDMAVLLVNHSHKGDIVGRENAEKLETFFKDLNSRNEVAIISLASSQEACEALREVRMIRDHFSEEIFKEAPESVLQQKVHLEKELEMETKEGRKKLKLSQLRYQELGLRLKFIAKNKKKAERAFEKLKELEKENVERISTAMDEWIHNKGWLTSRTYIHVYSNDFVKGALIKFSQKRIKVAIKTTLLKNYRTKKKIFGNY